MDNTSTTPFNEDELNHYLDLYGEGGATPDGIEMAKELLRQGESHARAAIEIVASGETERSPFRYDVE